MQYTYRVFRAARFETIPNVSDVIALEEKSSVVSLVREKKGKDAGIVVILLLAKMSIVTVEGMPVQLTTVSERDEQFTVVPDITQVLVVLQTGGWHERG